jgi:hypothetical protein
MTMTNRKDSFVVDGIVQSEPANGASSSHRISIVAADGHVYDIEPLFVGAYLKRLVGRHVIARVVPLFRAAGRSLVRISSLNLVVDEHPEHRAEATDANLSLDVRALESQLAGENVGEIET